jgi:alkyl hydroperoxide reductase subunit AhpF
MLKEEMRKIMNPITLKVFIDKKSEPETKESLLKLKRIEEISNDKIKFEILFNNRNNELVEKYQIERFPTILLTDMEGKELIRYLSIPQGSELRPFIQALQVISGEKNYYEPLLKENLRNIKSSKIKVMVSKSCAYCPELITIVSQFALGSSGKIKVEIIDIGENPEIGNQYDIDTVPYMVINDGSPLIGLISPHELLEQLLNNSR